MIKCPLGNAGNMSINHIICFSFCVSTRCQSKENQIIFIITVLHFDRKIRLLIIHVPYIWIHLSFWSCVDLSLCLANYYTLVMMRNYIFLWNTLYTYGFDNIFSNIYILGSSALSVYLYVRPLMLLMNRKLL